MLLEEPSTAACGLRIPRERCGGGCSIGGAGTAEGQRSPNAALPLTAKPLYSCPMGRDRGWQEVLDAEVRRWSAMSCEELISRLHDVQGFEVQVNSKSYNVEV